MYFKHNLVLLKKQQMREIEEKAVSMQPLSFGLNPDNNYI